jgi:PBP1b-binding outer membrane lipoprotein LpoB
VAQVILIAFTTLLLMGCESMKFKNVAKTGATTAVTYVIAGPLPAIANLATSVAVDEVLPKEPEIKDIKTKTQAVALVATSWGMNALYAFIAFLLITNVLTPLLTKKWGYNEAKNKYRRKEDE